MCVSFPRLTSLPSFIRISLGALAEGDTRMRGMQNLSIPHAPLVISLPEIKCSPVFAVLHPNDRAAERVIAAHAAAPEWQNAGTFYFCPRRWQSVCQLVHARTVSACRTCFLPALCHLNHIVGGMGRSPMAKNGS